MGTAFCESIGESYRVGDIENIMCALIGSGVLLIADGGMIGGLVTPKFFNSTELILTEMFWWIEPEARGQGMGAGLLEAFEKRGRDLGVSAVSMMYLHDSAELAEFYESMGYRRYETAYLKVM